MTAIAVQEMTAEDFPRGFEIFSDSFGQDHEYINIVFPNHETAAGRVIGAQRLLGFTKAQPYATFLKAVDSSTGETIGMAKWNIYKDNNIPEEGGLGTKEFWTDEQTADYADFMFREYLVERRRAIRESGGNLVSLDLLIIDPKHQRKGAGRALIRWGTDKADEMGVDTVVEASKVGVPAYEAAGFKNLREVTIDPVPAGFESRPRQVFHWMRRPKRT